MDGIVRLVAVLSMLCFVPAALADWQETGRDKWRIVYIDDELIPTGQNTFAIREKREYVKEGASCSCSPSEVVIRYDVDSSTCTVQRYAMDVLDHDGNILSSEKGEEVTPNVSLAPYCKIAQVHATQTAEKAVSDSTVVHATLDRNMSR